MASLDEFAREQSVLASLKSTGHVSVNELATRFGVSTVTVRKDLDVLERRHLLRRVRGGAVSVDASDEGAFEMRLRHSRENKQAIARAVAPLVRDGDVIAIDSSTTTLLSRAGTAGPAQPRRHHQRASARGAVHGAVVGHGAAARRRGATLGRLGGRPDR